VDVLVVGGGITGASLMHWLRQGGVDAWLIERHRLAAGASGRNAGFLLAGVAANYADAVQSYGRAVAADIWTFTGENHARLREALGDQDVGYSAPGSMTVAGSTAEATRLEESAELLQEDGFQARYDVDQGSLFNPGDGEIDPAQAVAALAAPCRGRILTGTAVASIEAGPRGVLLATSASPIQAGVVVLATNAYTKQLLPHVPIHPARAQMLATESISNRLLACPVYSHWGYRYWRQRRDGRVLVGGYRDEAREEEVGFEEFPTSLIQGFLDAHLQRVGILAGVTHRWAGIMGMTADGLPLVGALPGLPGVFLCGGYSGHGMGFAFNAARRLAAHISTGASLPEWIRVERLPDTARHRQKVGEA
jgi:glycine/D-amino acid oxidase-like deaminating enzyme